MTTDSEPLAEQLAELQIKLTFLDDTVQALATADVDQSQRIAALERLVRELRGEVSSMRTDQTGDPHSEPPPPHY